MVTCTFYPNTQRSQKQSDLCNVKTSLVCIMRPCLKTNSNNKNPEWNSSVLKSTCCFPRGPELDSQHPYSSSQTSLTPVPGDLMPSSGFHRHQAHMWYIDTHASKPPTYMKQTFKILLETTRLCLLSVYVWAQVWTGHSACRGQKKAYCSLFSPFPMSTWNLPGPDAFCCFVWC